MFQEEYSNLEYFALAFTVASALLLAYTFLSNAKEITVFVLKGLWFIILDALFWPIGDWFSEDDKSRKKK